MALKIQLPPNVIVLLKARQKVDFTTPLYKKTIRKNVKIPVSKIIEVPPEKIFFFLKRVVGEDIHKGEVLAVKKKMFGEQKYYSEYSGVVKEVNHEDGTVTIAAQTGTEESLLCFFKGEVEDVEKNIVRLKVGKSKDYEVMEDSGDFGGEVYYMGEKDINQVKQEDIDKKVLVTRALESFNQVRLEVMGVKGFVTAAELSQEPSVSYARIKDSKELDEINKSNLPFCLVNGSVISFYE